MAISRQDVDATIELLCERFPRCFFVRAQAAAAEGRHFRRHRSSARRCDRAQIAEPALTHSCCNLAYRAAQLEGAVRIDLDGNPAGAVSEKDALSAARDVILRKAALKARSKPPQITSEIEPKIEPEPPKRASLADLRAAALRRKATA